MPGIKEVSTQLGTTPRTTRRLLRKHGVVEPVQGRYELKAEHIEELKLIMQNEEPRTKNDEIIHTGSDPWRTELYPPIPLHEAMILRPSSDRHQVKKHESLYRKRQARQRDLLKKAGLLDRGFTGGDY